MACSRILASCHRFVHTGSRPVRVRFAPSPTGQLHLGGLRTALYNFIFAQCQKGTFVLRIEDTDQKRIVPDAVEKLTANLQWAGIEPDEGPTKGGPVGPYFQSQRLELYQREVNQLLHDGHAYKCFCTEDRLDLLRREALKNREIPRYDNRCRSLADAQVQKNISTGMPYVIRFKLQDRPDQFEDLIFGNYTFNPAANEGDTVLIKSDGFPTYHFANVVDDRHMEISHVLRGEEWLMSTVKHIQMYEAFGWEPPKFAHLPLLLNMDGTKMSKRKGDSLDVEKLRAKGYSALTLINFLCSYGGGFDHSSGHVEEIYSLSDLINSFSIDKLHKNRTRIDLDRLDKIRRMMLLLTPVDQLVQEIRSLLETRKCRGLMVVSEAMEGGSAYILKVLPFALSRAQCIEDLVDGEMKFLWFSPTAEEIRLVNTYDKQTTLSTTKDLLDRLAMTEKFESVSSLLRTFAIDKELKFPTFMNFLRRILCGLGVGPPVGELMETLGKESVVSRLKFIIRSLREEK